jgi:hypothetical protein
MSVPKANATIMGLGITVAFLAMLLGAAIAVVMAKSRAAKKKGERYSLESRVQTPVERPSTCRIWMGKKIEARVPMNGYV